MSQFRRFCKDLEAKEVRFGDESIACLLVDSDLSVVVFPGEILVSAKGNKYEISIDSVEEIIHNRREGKLRIVLKDGVLEISSRKP